MLKKRKSIVIDGKLYYYSQVVMLPTNQKATKESIILHKNNFLTFKSLQTEKDVLIYNDKHFGDDGSRVQQLYILSDEEIKEGDWVLYNIHCSDKLNDFDTINEKVIITRYNKAVHPNIRYCKKIIATTDKSLTTNFGKVLGDFVLLPQPSQSFIQKFVEEYNKGNIITEVMVEFKGVVKHCGGEFIPDKYTLKVSKDNTITIWIEDNL